MNRRSVHTQYDTGIFTGFSCQKKRELGHRAPWTAQSARNKALCLAKGKDPVEKRRERRRKQVELRFDRYVELFTEEYLKRHWKDWSRIRSMLVSYAVPAIGTKRLSDVRRSDLTAIYRRLDNRPSVARAMHCPVIS